MIDIETPFPDLPEHRREGDVARLRAYAAEKPRRRPWQWGRRGMAAGAAAIVLIGGGVATAAVTTPWSHTPGVTFQPDGSVLVSLPSRAPITVEPFQSVDLRGDHVELNDAGRAAVQAAGAGPAYGYIKADDWFGESEAAARTPAEALAAQAKLFDKNGDMWIPIYGSDHTTLLGMFNSAHVSG